MMTSTHVIACQRDVSEFTTRVRNSILILWQIVDRGSNQLDGDEISAPRARQRQHILMRSKMSER